jgi:N utilization substance protein B
VGQRRRSRECALQLLFQLDLTGEQAQDVFPSFWTAQPSAFEIKEFAERLVLGVTARRRGLDRVLAGSSENWRIDRMAVVDRNVLRMAVYELFFEPDTPAAVVIDEAVEVAKRFGGDESGAFINGVLDAVRRLVERGEVVAPPAD